MEIRSKLSEHEDKLLELYRALVIENNPAQMRSWITKLNKVGVDVVACSNFLDATAKLKAEPVNFAVVNKKLLGAGKKGIKSLINLLNKQDTKPILIIYPALSGPSLAKEFDIFTQFDLPISDKEFNNLIREIKTSLNKASKLLAVDDPLVKLLKPFLIFRSRLMKEGLALLPKIAQVPYSVLITGATGTGKEMVAQAIHFLSKRAKHKFIAINCGAVPESLIESELFGHEKGSFTGAEQRRIGKFEEAHRGTLFLDEIGEMPLNMQVRLLRVLEEGAITRIGGNQLIMTDVRIIAATQVDLAKAVENGTFREDLYYRLNVLYIHLPKLSKRQDDILLLANHFLAIAFSNIGYSQPYPQLSLKSIKLLKEYPWPGNVRELKNFSIRVATMLPSRVSVIKSSYILRLFNKYQWNKSTSLAQSEQKKDLGIFIPWDMKMKEAKDRIIKETLQKNNYQLTKTAKSLGMSARHLGRLAGGIRRDIKKNNH